MTSEVKPGPATPETSPYRRRTLHVFTLCGFAFTVPILTALARQQVYIHDQQFGWTEIGALLIGLAICLPFAFVLADRLALEISKRLRGWGRNTVFFGLFALILLSMIRPYASAPWIALSGFAGYLTILLALIGASLAVWLYEKFGGIRLWVTISAIGLVVFPGVFLRQFYSIRQSELKAGQPVVASHPTHVVMVVFDEFSGTTLLNDRMEIDARRFPQFARLANISTFYRNATTVHPRTIVAVPAILSGRFPERELAPLAANYPGNLFQTIQSTGQFEMAVFEPATRLYLTREHPHKSQRTALRKIDGLVRTLSTIYLRLIITEDLTSDFPTIPSAWSSVEKAETEVELTHGSEGRFNYPELRDRPQQLAHFLNCIKPSDRPRFTFLHVELPHPPWVFFPTGEQYVHETSHGGIAGAVGGMAEDWLSDPATLHRTEFRYRLQVGFVDRFLGRLLDQLVETNVLEKCLLIVTADHGVSFRPGHSRRLLDADNLADIASVPLFIKLPGQKTGRVDDRNVESVDILPTIAESLGIELSEPIDGFPVSQERRRPRKTLYYNGSMTVIEPDLPQRRAAVLRQFEFFGHDDLNHLPPSVATHPEWRDRKIASFVVEGKPVPATLIDPLRDQADRSPYSWTKAVETSRGFLKGKIDRRALPETPAELIVAVDGIVCDSERTFQLYGNRQGFEFLLPKSVIQNAANVVQLYLVNRSHNPPSLRPVSTSSEHQF
jgi:sulfatase-like protein